MVILNGGAQGIDHYVLHHVQGLPHGHVIETDARWHHPGTIPPAPAVTAIVFRPNYKLHGKRYAPIARNLHMLDLKPEMVVVLHNGESPGSRHVIEEARRRGLETQVIIA